MSQIEMCYFDPHYLSSIYDTFHKQKSNLVKFRQFILNEKCLMIVIEFKDGHVELVPSYKIRFLTDADKEKLNIGC